MFEHIYFLICEQLKYNFVFWVCFVLYIDVLITFYEIQYKILYIRTYLRLLFEMIPETFVFENDGDATPVGLLKLLLRPWDLSLRAEHQKLRVNSWEENVCACLEMNFRFLKILI